GVRIACLEEIAMDRGWITPDSAHALGAAQANSGYGEYVMAVARAHGADAPS
ncbi:glucose-1-phosphate thymidylyltransferase, partial [Pseudonocardia sp. K10HN5]|nr:glucose-1-phosphate thymidylyltransferase [Pseudonocardia acidicola]